MAKYQIGDRLYFHTADDGYNIVAGDTAEIVGWCHVGFCVRFDRNVQGHDCDMPHMISREYGWWLLASELDRLAYVIDDPPVLSAPDLEGVL